MFTILRASVNPFRACSRRFSRVVGDLRKSKEGACRGVERRLQITRFHSTSQRQKIRHVNNIGWLIRPGTAQWLGRQIRAVRLHHEPIQRHDVGRRCHFGGIAIRHNACQRDRRPEGEHALGHVRSFRETVKHTSLATDPPILQRTKHVIHGLAAVQHDGIDPPPVPLEGFDHVQLLLKQRPLHIQCGVRPVPVQPHFAPGHTLGMVHEPGQTLDLMRTTSFRRMHACGTPHIRVCLRQRRGRDGVIHVNGDRNHAGQPGIAGGVQHRQHTTLIPITREMAMRVIHQPAESTVTDHCDTLLTPGSAPGASPSDHPMRIVTLTPSSTEILHAIGGSHMLVGRCHDSDTPASITEVPCVTASRVTAVAPDAINSEVASHAGEGLQTLDESLLASLKPDLIITQRTCGVCTVAADRVTDLATSLNPPAGVCTLDPVCIEDVLDDVVRVGDACGLADQAARCMVALRARYWEARDRVNPYVDGPRVAVVEWVAPLHLAGHWTPGLISDAGGLPLGPLPGTPSKPMDPQTLIQADPDVIIVAPCGVSEAGMAPHRRAVAQSDWWPRLRAVQTGQVHWWDGTATFSRPGPRLFDCLERLVDLISQEAPGRRSPPAPPVRTPADPE